jgi:hypothetical protein
MRLVQKHLTISSITNVLAGLDQSYDRYLFLPVLSKRWLTDPNKMVWSTTPN